MNNKSTIDFFNSACRGAKLLSYTEREHLLKRNAEK